MGIEIRFLARGLRRVPPQALRAGVAAALLAAPLLLAGPARAGLPQTIDKIKRSIVAVGTVQPLRQPPGRFTGTGFVVGDGRHVITNAHVVPSKLNEKNREFLAVLVGPGRGDVRSARVVSKDLVHDMALLAFDGKPLPAVSFGDSGRVREGELYAFTGFPIGIVLGMRPVTHRGIISAITPIAIPQLSARQLSQKMLARLADPYDVFQLDATAYPGNSGSPLYDPVSGRVVGVVNKVFVKESKENILEKPSGIAYAIPIRYAKRLLQKAGIESD